MPKSEQTIMLTYWHTSPTGDLSEIEQIRELSQSGVYDAKFFRAQRSCLLMKFMCDEGDQSQIERAIAYAKWNLYRKVMKENVLDLQIWFNGDRIVLETQTSQG